MSGRKLAFIDDGNNVATSLLFGATLLGMDFATAGPAGYGLPGDVWVQAERFAAAGGSHLLATDDLQEAVAGADVIYSDVWTLMGEEDEAGERVSALTPYQVDRTPVWTRGRKSSSCIACLLTGGNRSPMRCAMAGIRSCGIGRRTVCTPRRPSCWD